MKPAHIKIIDLRKEPKESITKKLLNISSKRKMSLRIKNWVIKISNKDKYPITVNWFFFRKTEITKIIKNPKDINISGM